MQMVTKKVEISILVSKLTLHQNVTSDKEGHYIMTEGSIQQETRQLQI